MLGPFRKDRAGDDDMRLGRVEPRRVSTRWFGALSAFLYLALAFV